MPQVQAAEMERKRQEIAQQDALKEVSAIINYR